MSYHFFISYEWVLGCMHCGCENRVDTLFVCILCSVL